MIKSIKSEAIENDIAGVLARASELIYPQRFGHAGGRQSSLLQSYLSDSSTAKLAQFFQAKGLAAIKDEDQREQWYDDWLAYQAEHGLYARMLLPKEFSQCGGEFDLLRY